MNYKSIEKLNEKIWYRLLKTIYIIIFIGLFIYFNTNSFQYRFQNNYLQAIFINNLIILFLFEFIKRIFYYITFGKINPKKHNNSKNKNINKLTKNNIIKNLFKGRIKRLEYFLGVLLFPAIIFHIYFYSINYILDLFSPNSIIYLFLLIPVILLLLFDIALSIRRLHDIGWSGITVLLIFIPGIGQLFFLVLLFVSGDKKENKYGLPPTKKISALDAFKEIINLNFIQE